MCNVRVVFILITTSVMLFLALSRYKFEKIFPKQERSVKTILYWTPMFRRKDFYLGLGAKIFENCTYTNCYATNNRSYLSIDEFDAIAFHGQEYTAKRYKKPERRSPGQIYIYGNMEPPAMAPKFIKDFSNFYNWTMTHRLDSDVRRLYGAMEKQKTPYQPPSIEEIEARPKKIAWFVSRCKAPSKREEIAKELSKYIQVDIYGKYSNLTCGKRMNQECYNFLEKNFKFYLSFENSVCEDYITEKSYFVLQKNIVPIVYGGADYTKLVPPNSVINVMDYKTVKELSEYIRLLDSHTEEYLKFFEWKTHYFIHKNHYNAVCDLVQKLNEPIVPKSYSDIMLWWNGEKGTKCWKGFDKQFLQP